MQRIANDLFIKSKLKLNLLLFHIKFKKTYKKNW